MEKCDALKDPTVPKKVGLYGHQKSDKPFAKAVLVPAVSFYWWPADLSPIQVV